MNIKKKIIEKIQKKNAKICVVGLGYVGLPVCLEFIKKNFYVIGYDKDLNKIQMLNQGRSYINQIKIEKYKKKLKKNFIATNNYKYAFSFSDVIIFCLPTPLNSNNTPNLSYVENSLKDYYKYMKEGQVICFESTSYPGTTEKYFSSIIKKKGFTAGKNIFLVYSPEREDPGNKIYKINSITKIVSGSTKSCLELGKLIYSQIVKKIFLVEDIKTAEMSKLLENIYRSVNISLINELKIICHKMKINIFDVIKAAKTKPFGFQAFE